MRVVENKCLITIKSPDALWITPGLKIEQTAETKDLTVEGGCPPGIVGSKAGNWGVLLKNCDVSNKTPPFTVYTKAKGLLAKYPKSDIAAKCFATQQD